MARANPIGDLYVFADNLSSHKSPSVAAWLEAHPHVHQVFIPVGACWLNLQKAWWRLFRRAAVAGQTFVDADEIARATRAATAQINRRAKPWVWNRPPRPAPHPAPHLRLPPLRNGALADVCRVVKVPRSPIYAARARRLTA